METRLKIAICDDNPVLRMQLKEDVEAYFSRTKIQVEIDLFESGEALTEKPQIYHMAFLDVEMKTINGITAGYWLKDQNPDIYIFIITAYEKYLDDAFDLNVFRYLQKPVDKERLYHGLSAALARNRRLTCRLDGRMEPLFVKDIVCVYSERGKTMLVTQKKTYSAVYPLAFWKDNLYEPFFVQPHSSYIVNCNYVSLFEKEAVTLEYGDKQVMKVYISQRKYFHFKHDFFQWMECGK